MKRSASLIVISTSVLFLASALPVFATTNVDVSSNGAGAHTNVNVETNTGGNTICVNGKCTTSSGSSNGTSKVCVNGVCHESTDGNMNYQSDDGNTKVQINNNTEDSTVNDTIVTKPGVPTITPTVFKNTIKQHVEASKEEVKQKVAEAEHGFDLGKFLHEEMTSINDFFANMFGK